LREAVKVAQARAQTARVEQRAPALARFVVNRRNMTYTLLACGNAKISGVVMEAIEGMRNQKESAASWTS
jgi:hypothetical protein